MLRLKASQVAQRAIKLLAVAALFLFVGNAQASNRLALVIGNANYDHVPSLATPTADARAVAAALRGMGYVVNVQTDMGNAMLRNVLSDFARQASGADAAIIYFAGYGITVDSQNYLLPVDASPETRAGLIQMLPADALYRAVDGVRGPKLVILDASRHASFATGIGADHGFAAPVQMTPNLLILYAAQAGTVAADRGGANSALAQALVRDLPGAGDDFAVAVGKVRQDVRAATGGQQDPAIFGSVAMQIAGPENGNIHPDESNNPPDNVPADKDLAMWEAIGPSPDKSQLQTYLMLFPNGAHVGEAKTRLAALSGPQPHRLDNPRRDSDPYTSGMPAFTPWPPPVPSEQMVLSRERLTAGLNTDPSLGAIGQRLSHALRSAGYSEFTFYRVPTGFAIVAKLEQIAADGTPEPQRSRFNDPNAQSDFSLARYIEHLFYAPKGFYRLIVFAVTSEPIVPKGAAQADRMKSMVAGGANKLPSAYNKMKFTIDHDVTALIYEFSKSGDKQVSVLMPGRLDARTHLEKSGLYSRLMNGGQ
jgi:hypothetical protein